MKEHITTGGKTLCWTCRKAYGKCSWTEVDYTKKGWPIRFEPVKGWNAIPTKNEKYTSFLVVSAQSTILMIERRIHMTADFAGMGKRLREAREKELMSQNDLALESGVAPSTISYIECGHSTASVWVLAHICDALGVSMQWMVYGRGRK